MKQKFRYVLLGIVIGMVIMATGTAFTYQSKSVVAQLVDDITLFIDDKLLEMPEEYQILAYNGRTYLPVRFIAESLNAEVNWNEASRKISIKTKECQVEDKQVNDEKKVDEKQPSVIFKQIPQSIHLHNMDVSVTLSTRDNNLTRIYLRVENKQQIPIQLLLSEVEAIVDGKTYRLIDSPSFQWDTRWYNDILRDETRVGYLTFSRIPEDKKEMSLNFAIKYNDGSNNRENFNFNIVF